MDKLDYYPKSIKKAVRYMKQDASREELLEIRDLINNAIINRINRIDKETRTQKENAYEL
ncbi:MULTISPECIES: hypothetical protein [unclassified Domibacillus]|uniref:hypothetical protein n=1 Tax=unclassified Domibacillus TaxID=2632383 RepID=UPI001F5A0B46|nr:MULTISPECIES: hypothetical protein [unclassified Domibacillus]MCI2252748.1 hypothetical protein [Domibacillus sp. PGB-M46]